MAWRIRLPVWNRPPSRGRTLVARGLVAIGAAALAIGISANVWADDLPILWYRYQGSKPISPADLDRVAKCEPPSWLGLVRLVAQDQPVSCPDGTVSTWIAGWRTTGRAWVAYASGPAATSDLMRARAGLALLGWGKPAPEGLSAALADPRAAGERRVVLRRMLAGELDSGWIDPTLQRELTWARPGDASPAELADLLRIDGIEGPEVRGAHTREALRWAGVPAARLMALARSRARGGSVVADPAVLREIDRDHRCVGLDTRICAAWAADQLERAEPPDGGPEGVDVRPTPVTTLPAPLWDALWQDPEVTRASSAWFDALAAWVAAGPDREARAERLRGLVSLAHNAAGAQSSRDGEAGDPAWVVRARGGTPWTSALAARAIGSAAAVPVSVSAVGDIAVLISIDGLTVAVGPCGAPFVPPATAGPAVSDDHLLGRAAVEGVGGRLRVGDWPGARRLARLAAALDPAWADGVPMVVEVVAPPVDGDAARGALLGALIDTASSDTGRWGHAAVEWSLDVDPARCPGPLSP